MSNSCNYMSSSGSCASTHSRYNKNNIDTADKLPDYTNVFFNSLFSSIRLSTGTKTTS